MQVIGAHNSAPQAAFPRVNLIPAQIAQEARVGRAKQIVVVSVVASIAAVGGLFVMASGQVSSAQEQLDTVTARSAALAAESTKYADVPKVQVDLQSAQAQQSMAMSGEVRWSLILNNLALTIPQGVSITTLKATITGASGDPAAATAGSVPAVQSVLGNPGIGTLSYEGQALDNAKVAAFLEALARNTGVIDPFVSAVSSSTDGATATPTGTKPTQPTSVNYTATATISAKALSHRYDAKGN